MSLQKTISAFVGRLRTSLYLLVLGRAKSKRLRQLSEFPIVIGGCGRSGTSLLLTLLSCHPEIVAIEKETGGLCPRVAKSKWGINPKIRLWHVYRRLASGDIPETAKRWCEKTPRNVQNYQAILDYFGERVRIINIVRDGRDVVTSLHPSDDVNPMIEYHVWCRDVNEGFKFADHPQILTIRYEDLVTDYVAVINKICIFLGIGYVKEFDEYPHSARVKTHSGFKDGARPISSSSIGRWKDEKYSALVEKLISDEKGKFLLEYYQYLH